MIAIRADLFEQLTRSRGSHKHHDGAFAAVCQEGNAPFCGSGIVPDSLAGLTGVVRPAKGQTIRLEGADQRRKVLRQEHGAVNGLISLAALVVDWLGTQDGQGDR